MRYPRWQAAEHSGTRIANNILVRCSPKRNGRCCGPNLSWKGEVDGLGWCNGGRQLLARCVGCGREQDQTPPPRKAEIKLPSDSGVDGLIVKITSSPFLGIHEYRRNFIY